MYDPTYGLSDEEAWRRYRCSNLMPHEVYRAPGPWTLILICLPHDAYWEKIWSWCFYCDGPTDDVAYAQDDGYLWLCTACAEWAEVMALGCCVIFPQHTLQAPIKGSAV